MIYKLLTFGGITVISAFLLSSCAMGTGNEGANTSGANVREIKVITRDNLEIAVQHYTPKNQEKMPTVLLLHMLSKDNTSWNKYIPTLLNNGYSVYSADLRGHGRSTKIQNGQRIFYQNMNETDWEKIPDDVADLVNFISKDKYVDLERMGIIGASIGANSAIIAASANPDKIKTIVAISPGLNYHGMETYNAASNLKIPVLMAVSSGDSYSFDSSNQLNKVVKSKHNLLIYKGSEHGTNLLNESEDLQTKIVEWLNENLKK